MQSTNELHERYLQALHAQRESAGPKKAFQRLWLSMFLMMLGLLALFWLFFIEPLTSKKGPVPEWVNRPRKPEEEEEGAELEDSEPPTSEKSEGPSGHSLGSLPDDLTDRLN